MTIAVVQTAPVVINGYSGAFSSNITIGNTVFLNVSSSSGGAAISTSAPLYNGSPVTGAVQLFAIQGTNPGVSGVYDAVWMLPNVQTSGTSFSITVTGGNSGPNVGIVAYEVSGLGTSPAADTTSPNPAANSATTGTAVASGPTGAIVSAPDIIFGGAGAFGIALNGAGAPWTETPLSASKFVISAYQIVTSSGGTFNYSQTDASSGVWCAGVVAVAGTPAAASAVASVGDTDVSWEKLQLLGVV